MLKVGDIVRREIARSNGKIEYTYGEVKKIIWLFWALVQFDDDGCACFYGAYCKVKRWPNKYDDYEIIK